MIGNQRNYIVRIVGNLILMKRGKKINLKKLTLIAALCLFSSVSCIQPQSNVDAADSIFFNGQIYTVDIARRWVNAIAIKDGRFIYVGDNDEALKFIGPSTETTDLNGQFVIPGIIDGHTHPGYNGAERFIRLTGTNPEEFLKSVQDYSRNHPGDDMIRLCCWSNNWYVTGKEGPHKESLDAVVSDRPVWINSTSWHSAWLNSKALEKIGVDNDTPDPKTGVAVYQRDDDGELTGWVKEGAAWQYFADEFPVDKKYHQEGMLEMLKTLSNFGVTTLYDGGNFGYEDEVYSFLSQLEKNGQLPIRYQGTYQIFFPERRFDAISEMRRLQKEYGGSRLQFKTIKLFMDGINENRTGAILNHHSDNPDYIGDTMLSVEELRDFLIELHEEELDIHIHIIGDMAARVVLDGVEAAKEVVGNSFYPRVTVAHIELTDPADYDRFADLGVIANFTPWWHGVDINNVVDAALGPDRITRTYTAKPLFDSGALVTFSSDGWGRLTQDYLSPYLGMQVGHNRQYPKEWLAEGDDGDAYRLPDSEKLSLELMIQGYTINAAHQFRLENDIGSIEVGKLADFVILNNNLFDLDPYKIWKAKTTAVIMEGELIQGAL